MGTTLCTQYRPTRASHRQDGDPDAYQRKKLGQHCLQHLVICQPRRDKGLQQKHNHCHGARYDYPYAHRLFGGIFGQPRLSRSQNFRDTNLGRIRNRASDSFRDAPDFSEQTPDSHFRGSRQGSKNEEYLPLAVFDDVAKNQRRCLTEERLEVVPRHRQRIAPDKSAPVSFGPTHPDYNADVYEEEAYHDQDVTQTYHPQLWCFVYGYNHEQHSKRASRLQTSENR
mmetsp:Transcript_16472/g.34098  ORF Transcript_16472/g.34098 Transcript_16472/m.34098 type:complete len:226 (+) Transcript_16472:401-1078(+)